MLQKLSIKIKKKIIVITSTIAFILLLIWALLSANNQKINLNLFSNDQPKRTNQPILIKTGSIRINNDEYKEKNLKAFINGEKTQIKQNIISNLDPGQYELILSMDGYNDWKSSVKIEPGLITEISPFLFPKKPNLELKIPSTNIDKIFFPEYGDYVYYVVSQSAKGIENGIYQLQLPDISTIFTTIESEPVKITNIIPDIKQAIETQSYDIKPSPDNKKIIFSSELTHNFIFDTENPNLNLTNDELISLEKILGFKPEKFDWFRGSSSIVIKDKTLLMELILSNEKNTIIEYHPETFPTYDLNPNLLIYKSNNEQKLFIYKDETSSKIELENQNIPENISEIYIDKNTGRFLIYKSQNSYYFLDTKQSFIEKIDENINLIEYSKDGMSVLYQKENNLYSYTINENKAKNQFFTKHNLIIENFDSQNQEVHWSTSSSHIILVTTKPQNQRTITIIDKDGKNRIEIFSSDKISNTKPFILSDNTEMILLMKDAKEKESEKTIKNLYKLELTKKQYNN